MKKSLLCAMTFLFSLPFVNLHSSQMTPEEMAARIAELEGRLATVEADRPITWSDPRFSEHLAEVYVEQYHVFNNEFGDGRKSGFVRERNKALGFLRKAVETDIGRTYAVHQLREKTGILKSDPHTWAAQGIAEAEKHLGIANRLSGLVFEKYFKGKSPIVFN